MHVVVILYTTKQCSNEVDEYRIKQRKLFVMSIITMRSKQRRVGLPSGLLVPFATHCCFTLLDGGIHLSATTLSD